MGECLDLLIGIHILYGRLADILPIIGEGLLIGRGRLYGTLRYTYNDVLLTSSNSVSFQSTGWGYLSGWPAIRRQSRLKVKQVLNEISSLCGL